jgi:hypothetical protein
MYFNDLESGELTATRILLQKYKERPDDLKGLTYFKFIQRYDFNTYKFRLRASPRVPKYYPHYD